MEDVTVQADASDREPHSILEDIRALDEKARAVLFDALLPGEHPHVVVGGAAGSAIVATGERILVIKAGARSGAILGARCKAFEYESVIGVRLDTESSKAVIAVDAPVKIASCRVYWADTRDNAWKARNAIPVEGSVEPAGRAVEAIRGLLEAYRDRHPRPVPRQAPAPRSPLPRAVKILPDTDEPPKGDADGGVVSPLPVLGERCPRCRADVRPAWRFCPKCGASSESATRTPSG